MCYSEVCAACRLLLRPRALPAQSRLVALNREATSMDAVRQGVAASVIKLLCSNAEAVLLLRRWPVIRHVAQHSTSRYFSLSSTTQLG